MRGGGIIIKLIILSLVVGFVLHYFGLTPVEVFEGFFENVGDLFRWAMRHAQEIGLYLMTGAVIVVPVWGVFALLRYLRNRGS